MPASSTQTIRSTASSPVSRSIETVAMQQPLAQASPSGLVDDAGAKPLAELADDLAVGMRDARQLMPGERAAHRMADLEAFLGQVDMIGLGLQQPRRALPRLLAKLLGRLTAARCRRSAVERLASAPMPGGQVPVSP